MGSLCIKSDFKLSKDAVRCNGVVWYMARNKRFRDFFVVGAFRCMLLLIRFTPGFAISAFAHSVCFITRTIESRDVRIMRDNLVKVRGLELGSSEMAEFEKKVLYIQVCSTLETIKTFYNPGKLRIDGVEQAREIVEGIDKAGKGSVQATGHLGSWECAGRVGALVSKNGFCALAKPFGPPAITRFLGDFRKRLGMNILWTDESMVLKSMIKTLRSGGGLGIVMDQRPEGEKGVEVDFLGQKTFFVGGPARVIAKTGCGVAVAFCLRKGPMHYEIVGGKLLDGDHGITDVEEITQMIASEIGRVIDLYPHQWTWNNNRWKVRKYNRKAKKAG